MTAVLCNLFLLATAIVGLANSVPSNFQFAPTVDNVNKTWGIFFNCLALLMYSIMGLSGEANFPVFITHFGIWPTYWMRSIWYILMALFSFGLGGLMGILCSLVLVSLSIFLLVLHLLSHEVPTKGFVETQERRK